MTIINCSKLRVCMCVFHVHVEEHVELCVPVHMSVHAHMNGWMAEIEIICDSRFSIVFPDVMSITHSTHQASDLDPRVTMDSIKCIS